MNTWLIDVIKTNIGSEAEHQSALYHVRTNHTAGTDDQKLVIT